jgi:hypothetical protein
MNDVHKDGGPNNNNMNHMMDESGMISTQIVSKIDQ